MLTLTAMTRTLWTIVFACCLTSCIATIKGVRESAPILSGNAPGSYQAVAQCLAGTYESSDVFAFVRMLDVTEAKRATVTAAYLPIFIWPQPSFIFEASVSQKTTDMAEIKLRTGWFTWGRESATQDIVQGCLKSARDSHAIP